MIFEVYDEDISWNDFIGTNSYNLNQVFLTNEE